jgi:hypothetical protein
MPDRQAAKPTCTVRTLLVRAEAIPERVEAPAGLVRPSLSTRRTCAGLTSLQDLPDLRQSLSLPETDIQAAAEGIFPLSTSAAPL